VEAGATGALACAVGAIAEAGEEVLILSPFWPLIRGIVQAFRGRPVEVPFYDRVDSAEATVEAVRERPGGSSGRDYSEWVRLCYTAPRPSGWPKPCGAWPGGSESARQRAPRPAMVERDGLLCQEPADAKRGQFRNLGYELERNTIKRILLEHGIDPVPLGKKGMSWVTFLKAHRGAIAATDFFSVELLTWTGLVRHFVLFINYYRRAV